MSRSMVTSNSLLRESSWLHNVLQLLFVLQTANAENESQNTNSKHRRPTPIPVEKSKVIMKWLDSSNILTFISIRQRCLFLNHLRLRSLGNRPICNSDSSKLILHAIHRSTR